MIGHQKIKLDELKPGMRIARRVENEYGASLIPPGMIVDQNMVLKLRKMKIRSVYILDETAEKQQENIQSFTADYQHNVEEFKDLFHKLSHSGKLEYTQYHRISEIVQNTLNIDTNRDIINMLGQVRDVDQYTYTHSINVGIMSMLLGKWGNLQESTIKNLIYAGLMHDIGKSRIPQNILNKQGKLTAEEYEVIKKHSIYGYELTNKCGFISNEVGKGVLFHHERLDGSGYPLGLPNKKIPLVARVLAITDTFDAMISDRVYRNHRPPFDVFKLLEKEFNLYDYNLAKIFMNNLSQFYVGEEVELSNGETGEIVFINQNHIAQPVVKVNDKFINLYQVDLEINDVFVKSKVNQDFFSG